jgi:predicted DNA-binding WGR domain protein
MWGVVVATSVIVWACERSLWDRKLGLVDRSMSVLTTWGNDVFRPLSDEEREPLYLRRVDDSRNMWRFYKLCLQPTLFGEVMLVRNWGRVGTNGQVKFETFEAAEDAEKAMNRIERSKRRRGYVDC